MSRLNLFVTEDYEDKSGEKKTHYTQVGNVVPHTKGGGFSVYIRPGIAVSGELVIFLLKRMLLIRATNKGDLQTNRVVKPHYN